MICVMSEIEKVFENREEIFPKWFLESLGVLRIIEQHKIRHSKLLDERLPFDKYCYWDRYYRTNSAGKLINLYIDRILNHYSNGLYSGRLHNLLRDKNSREIWLFYRLSKYKNNDDVHKFAQKIIDDIIKCPFEIDWNFPIKDPFLPDWTKEKMCTHITSDFYQQVNKEQVEMLFPYVINSSPFWILTFWIENGLINIYPYSQKIISRVQGVFDKCKIENRNHIASLKILGGSRYEQKEYPITTELRKFIVSTKKFPKLYSKLVILFDNEVKLYNIMSFDHHVYFCESSYDIKHFQALPFIDGSRMKVVKRWFKWVLE